MKYSLFFGETEKRILEAKTPKEVMQIAWQAGILLPKKAVIELFREVKKVRQQANRELLDEKALETVTGGANALQEIFCRCGRHDPGRGPADSGLCVCARCGQTFRIVPHPKQPE